MAVDYALSWGLDAIEARVTDLAEKLRRRLSEFAGVRVHDSGVRRCGIVSFTVEGRDAADIQRSLAQRHINIGVSPRVNPRLGPSAPDAGDLARASVHYYNTEDELDQLAAALPPAVL